MDLKETEIDKALCCINDEYLKIKNSKEYRTGRAFTNFLYACKHFRLDMFASSLKNRYKIKELKKYDKANENFLTFNSSIDILSKIAVYTCITGDYDIPMDPVYIPEGVDFYLVTDMEVSSNSRWKKIDINSIKALDSLDNAKKARYVKTHPHVFFPQYEYSIWVDANIKVVGNLSKYVKCIGDIPFASNWHPSRNCIYTEAIACVNLKKDNSELIKNQIKSYEKEGMPHNFGLIETNMIVRKHNDERCIDLMEDWWDEIKKWSKRDQLSLPYVIWKNGYTMKSLGFIGTNVRKNPSVQVVPHKKR